MNALVKLTGDTIDHWQDLYPWVILAFKKKIYFVFKSWNKIYKIYVIKFSIIPTKNSHRTNVSLVL